MDCIAVLIQTVWLFVVGEDVSAMVFSGVTVINATSDETVPEPQPPNSVIL